MSNPSLLQFHTARREASVYGMEMIVCKLTKFLQPQLYKDKESKNVPPTLRRRNLKTEISLWKRIKCFPSTLRRRNLKTQQSSAILDLCLKKPRAGKSRDYRDVIVFEKLRFRDG